MTEFIPTKHEIEVMLMIDGALPLQGGAWFNAAVGFLQQADYVTKSWTHLALTAKGRKYIDDYRSQGTGPAHL